MKTTTIMLGAAVAAAIATSATAQPSGRERITLYDGPNYSGQSSTYDYDVSNLPREFQDRAMSVRIVGSWRICADSNYQGRCEEIDRDVPDLRRLGLDRSISSMKNFDSYGGGGGGGSGGGSGGGWGGGNGGGWGGGNGGATGRERITLYDGPNFSGRSVTYDHDISNLPREFQDRAMSVRIVGSWRICADSNYRGNCAEIDRDVRDLRSLGLDRSISSMKNFDSYGGGGGGNGGGWGGGNGGGNGGGWGRDRITLYDGPNFSGRSVSFDNDITNLPREFQDRAMSVRVQGRWQVCADSNFQGRCAYVDRDIRDLRSIGLDESISSMRSQR